MRLKILSWNIWFNGHLAKVNEFLEKSRADVIGLQEVVMVDKKLQLSKRLLKDLGYKYIYAPAFQHEVNGQPTDVGNAVFSKFPILDYRIHHLSEHRPRVAIQADIQIGGEILHVFGTHLIHTHQQPSDLQEQQAANLVKILPNEKTVLMGDFNALPGSKTIEIVAKKMINADPNTLPTWSVYPEGCKVCLPQGIVFKLDNIFVSRDLKCTAYKVGQSAASDHQPISVTIKV